MLKCNVVGWSCRHNDFFRNVNDGTSLGCRVDVLQNIFDEFWQIAFEFFIDNPTANTTDAPTANDELLNGGG